MPPFFLLAVAVDEAFEKVQGLHSAASHSTEESHVQAPGNIHIEGLERRTVRRWRFKQIAHGLLVSWVQWWWWVGGGWVNGMVGSLTGWPNSWAECTCIEEIVQ